MPQLDGVQAIEAILSEYPQTKILAISGIPRYASARLEVACHAGAADALQKPFNRETLLQSIHSLLNDTTTPAKGLTKVAESVRKIF